VFLTPLNPESSPDAAAVVRVARVVAQRGGRALLVGGYVRDRLLALGGRGVTSKDLDVEVFGLSLDDLAAVLSAEGTVDEVGVSFAVLMVHGLGVDFSVPRRDRKAGTGHRGFAVHADPTLSVAEAARRRDFTINSISMDPLSGEIIDPVGGVADLEEGILRATDPRTFGEDPLRALRAVQFAARFDLSADPDLVHIMRAQDLSELPSERVLAELRKLLLKGRTPSRGLDLLLRAGGLRHVPELGPPAHLQAAAAVLDSWVTRRPTDEAVAWIEGLALLVSPKRFDDFADRLRPPKRAARAVRTLLAEGLLPQTDPMVRRLARRLHAGGTSVGSLASIHSDRPRAAALVAQATRLGVLLAPLPSSVRGRHVLARGISAGPQLGAIVQACLDLQDETGQTDPGSLLDAVLGNNG
jgi:tRNA nucleotidyltransferase (CCA-adding enzyme)